MKLLPAPHASRPPLGLAALALALALAAALAACDWGGPVRIGFSGPLTGRWADLGVQGRNGATLAVEDLNARGGVVGRRVELVVADERDTPDAAPEAVRELDRQGAAVLVGLMTSAAALAGLPAAGHAGLAVISPTAMTPELTGQDDALFRVVPDLLAYARSLAYHANAAAGPGSALLVLDQGNAAFAEPYAQAFAETYARQGGRIAGTVRVPAGQAPDAGELARLAAAGGVRDILAVISAQNLARLVLDLRPASRRLRVYTAMWGLSPEFVEMAGAEAEGVQSCLVYPYDDFTPEVAAFNLRFRERFGLVPSFAAALSYESVMVAARALERTRGSRQGLAAALKALDPVPGLLGKISFDAAGDTVRPVFQAEVRDGRIATVGAGRE